MPDVVKGDWTDYEVEGTGKKDGSNHHCRPFTTVTHAAHLRQAVNIVREGRVRADPINDISLLAKTRLPVVFTSSFVWGTGSRYGCIAFHYDIDKLIEGKHIYWAEVVTKYKYPACRFLITENRYDDHVLFRPYDPEEDDGPWWKSKKSGRHYQNMQTACVEFMIDDDLPLHHCQKTEFVSHSGTSCCENKGHPPNCSEFGKPRNYVGARFVGQLLGDRLSPWRTRMTVKEGKRVVPSEDLQGAWRAFREQLWSRNADEFKGEIRLKDPAVPGIARAIFSAFGHEDREEMKSLCRLFCSPESAMTACARLLQEAFDLSDEPSVDEDG